MKELIEIIKNLDAESARALCLLICYYTSLIAGVLWLGGKIKICEECKENDGCKKEV